MLFDCEVGAGAAIRVSAIVFVKFLFVMKFIQNKCCTHQTLHALVFAPIAAKWWCEDVVVCTLGSSSLIGLLHDLGVGSEAKTQFANRVHADQPA